MGRSGPPFSTDRRGWGEFGRASDSGGIAMSVDSPLVLVVCAANVCRSPAAATMLRQLLSDAGGSGQVSSEGAHAVDGVGVEFALSSLPSRGFSSEGLDGHVARGIEIESLDRASLILTADEAVSSALIRTRPAVRARLFTLREAAGLTEVLDHDIHRRPVPDGDGRRSSDPRLPGPDDLNVLVSGLDRVRGWVPQAPPNLARHGWIRRRRGAVPISAFDVPDCHSGAGSANHAKTIDLMVDACVRISAAIASYVNGASEAESAGRAELRT